MKNRIISLLILLSLALSAFAQRKAIERTTDVLCVVPTATAALAAIVKHDKKGFLQLTLGSATSLAVNCGLELAIKKERPDGNDHHAFPSTHTTVAFSGATYLMRRYGWKWGVPAYAVSTYVAWGRTYAKRHDWWDVAAGAAIGAGCALIYTRPFARQTGRPYHRPCILR